MPGSIQSIERAAGILRLLAAEPHRFRLADLTRSLGLAKPTVHGILRTLQQAGFVEQDADTGEYRLGAALLHLGGSYLDGNTVGGQRRVWAGPGMPGAAEIVDEVAGEPELGVCGQNQADPAVGGRGGAQVGAGHAEVDLGEPMEVFLVEPAQVGLS